jgi:hypothetical protein
MENKQAKTLIALVLVLVILLALKSILIAEAENLPKAQVDFIAAVTKAQLASRKAATDTESTIKSEDDALRHQLKQIPKEKLMASDKGAIQDLISNINKAAEIRSRNTEKLKSLREEVAKTREEEIQSALKSDFISDWVGTLHNFENVKEDGFELTIEVASNIFFTSINASKSNIDSSNLIKQHTDIFDAAAVLPKGQKVVFSGQIFYDNEVATNKEINSLEEILEEPMFMFIFTSIKPIE